jgi:hypothetical protein
VGGELEAEAAAPLQRCMASEVGQSPPLLLAHVVAVGHPGSGHARPPRLRTDPVGARRPDGVTDVVVIADGIPGFLDPDLAHLEQLGIEDHCLGVGVGVEQDAQSLPNCLHRLGRGVDSLRFVKEGESAPLLLMVGQHELTVPRGSSCHTVTRSYVSGVVWVETTDHPPPSISGRLPWAA